ncbi:hypothetical protein BU16DRAFT_581399 [Lophium mytilinum]|uniref:Uncharacterized protein n=1 Tax=Lophium mytilinum TaxID=390894 RepID=A0A6A6QTW5_9PEZI|nr:hypothetical protein BU16DRAFT_581399 [Lophium mytilinum]
MSRGAKVLRQGAVQSVADNELVPTTKPYQASRLELLPPEIRLRIYFQLGIPDGHRGWYTCPDGKCTDQAHYRIPITNDGDFGPPGYRHPEHYQTSFLGCKIQKYTFDEYKDRRGIVDGRTDSENVDVLHDRYAGHDAEYFGLLCVNKFFCADIYSQTFSKIPVAIGFQLSNRAIHRNNWANVRKRGDEIEEPKYERMALSPFSFRFITSLILTYELGQNYAAEMPHGLHTCRRKTGALLQKQAMSIRYIARHCPALRNLEVQPSIEFFVRGKLSLVDTMAFAMRELVQGCPELEQISFAYNETRKVDLADFPELGEDSDYSDKFFHDLLFEEDVWFSIFNEKDCLELRGVPQYLREDRAAEWAKSVLSKMRNWNRLEPDAVPIEVYYKKVGLWGEKYSTAHWFNMEGRIVSNDSKNEYCARSRRGSSLGGW